jgi:peptide-methionine (S)-S-oxide reductase
VQIEYDPTRVSYEQLLDLFWTGHDPTRPAGLRQYASRIFYHDEEQRRLAEASREQYEARCDCQTYTEINPAPTFYLAEDYHQKYQLRSSRSVMREFTTIYPDPTDIVNSTAAARVNGYLGGHGTLDDLEAQIDDLGLSPGAREKLLNVVRNRQS